ncbi:MAG: serine/threonine protein kinase [Proteobacteria bacterium]|nr:serine/threonine protein kinase [Pseudomonadota bacterium]
MIGTKFGSYEIVQELGAGGMGKVYSAEHSLIGRRAAIKVLLSQFSRDEQVTERFFQEAKAAAMIRHSGIIDIFDYGWTEDGSRAYIMMELLEGESLRQRIEQSQRGRLSCATALRLARQMANALAAAHAVSIVHRDLKPDNVFIVPDAEVVGGERVKLLDFGIAKVTDELGNSLNRTTAGMIMGSPLYMSPEQCIGKNEVDYRADIYALGCVMYHLICGRPPFTGSGSGEIIAQHIYQTPDPPRHHEPSLDPQVESIIVCALAKKPRDRFRDMGEFEQALIRAGAASNTGPEHHVVSTAYPHQRPPAVELDQRSGQQSRVQGRSSPSGGHGSSMSPPSFTSPTTLGSVASQISYDSVGRKSRGKRWWLLIALFGLAAGSAGLALKLGAFSSEGPSVAIEVVDEVVDAASRSVQARPGDPAHPAGDRPISLAAAAAASADRTPDAAAEIADAPAEKAEQAETDPEPVELVTFRIKSSKPRRALVRGGDGKLLGETPFVYRVPRDGKRTVFILEQRGYVDRRVVLVADKDRSERVKLRRVRRSSAASARSDSAGEPAADRPDDKKTGKRDRDDWGQTTDPFDN